MVWLIEVSVNVTCPGKYMHVTVWKSLKIPLTPLFSHVDIWVPYLRYIFINYLDLG